LDGGYKWTETLDSVIEPPDKLYEYILDFQSMLYATEPTLNDPATTSSDIGTIAIVSHLCIA